MSCSTWGRMITVLMVTGLIRYVNTIQSSPKLAAPVYVQAQPKLDQSVEIMLSRRSALVDAEHATNDS